MTTDIIADLEPAAWRYIWKADLTREWMLSSEQPTHETFVDIQPLYTRDQLLQTIEDERQRADRAEAKVASFGAPFKADEVANNGVANCPFCDHPVQTTRTYMSSPGLLCVCCDHCQAEGPAADTAEEAIRLWNFRPRLSEAEELLKPFASSNLATDKLADLVKDDHEIGGMITVGHLRAAARFLNQEKTDEK